MRKKIALFLFLVAAFLVSIRPVSAGQDSSYGQYVGGRTAPSILIDKMVARPVETKGGKVDYNYVDNLTATDLKFKPNQYIFFRVSVKNTSDRELFDVILNDYVPNYLHAALEGATFDEGTHILTGNLGSFAPNEEKVFIIKTRVATADKFPADKGLICLTNRAEAKNADAADDDSSQFCIEKEVATQEVTKGGQMVTETVHAPPPGQIPSTGPEYGLAIVGLSSLMGYAGLKLRKYS